MSSLRDEEEEELKLKRKRAKRSHEMVESVIELENGSISRELMAKLCAEIIKYFLYDRQQIPFPMTNSKSWSQLKEKSAANQLSPKEEQLVLMFDKLNQILDELICLVSLESIEVQSVALSLGQTLEMPKEFYCLELPKSDIYSVVHSIDCPKQTLRSAVTRFFKTMLNDVNILSQNRRDIPITKIFVLIKINKCYVQYVRQHSSNCHHLVHNNRDNNKDNTNHFIPHIEYEIPRIGNRFLLSLKQKRCNCRLISDQTFQIYEENVRQNTSNDTKIEQQLSQTMSDVLTISEDIVKKNSNELKEDFIWIQILSSIKGIQFNSNKKN